MSHSYQSKWSEDREAGNVGQSQLYERQGHDDEIEDVPTFLEVKLWTHRHQFDASLDGKCGREKLKKDVHFLIMGLAVLFSRTCEKGIKIIGVIAVAIKHDLTYSNLFP